MLDYEGKEITVGARIELSPHCDLWMRGAKYGTITKLGNHRKATADIVRVQMDHPAVKRPKWYRASDLRVIGKVVR